MASFSGTLAVISGALVAGGAVTGQPWTVAAVVPALAGVGELFERLGVDPVVATWLGPAVLLIVPALLVVGFVLRRTADVATQTAPAGAPDDDQTTRYRPAGAGAVDANRPADRGDLVALHGLEEASVVVETDGEEPGQVVFRFALNMMLARIGREEDNEIRLEHPTVHRYHAMIRRDLAEGYEIADLSDETGNGVLVNGERVAHRKLYDGDVIELGAARLVFKGGS